MNRVGLVGYYHWGNYGDELFAHAYRYHLKRFACSVMHTSSIPPYYGMPLHERVRQTDALIIGGGDLLIPWFMSDLYWRTEYLAKPVFVFSVGVPTWGGYNAEIVAQYKSFLCHPNVRMIHARDLKSKQWIESFIAPPSEVTYSPDLVCSLDFRRVHTAQRVFGLITRWQEETEVGYYRNIEAICRKATGLGYAVHHIVLGIGATGQADLAEAKRFTYPGKRLIVCSSIEALSRALAHCSVVCSMKFHGCIVAHMMGIPTIALSGSDKFVSFFQMCGRERFISSRKDSALPDLLTRVMEPPSPANVAALRASSLQGIEALKRRLRG